MVHRWRCPECPFIVWAPAVDTVTVELAAHLCGHCDDTTDETVFRTTWTCPSCEERLNATDPSTIDDRIEHHLLTHERARIVDGTNLISDGWSVQSVLTLAPDNGAREFTRSHLLADRDTLVFVTTRPADRRQVLSRYGAADLDRVVFVVPSQSRPNQLPDLDGGELEIALEMRPVEATLPDLETAVGSILRDCTGTDTAPLVDVDLFEWLIDTHRGDSAFEFTQLFLGSIDSTDAVAHFGLDPTRFPTPTIRTFAPMFDLALAAHSDRLVSVVTDPAATVDSIPSRAPRSSIDSVRT